jgi:hypothetical protein
MLKALIEERLERLSEQSLDSGAEALDRRLRRIEGVADAVRYAPYGFSGFFDAVTIREDTLEKILETDLLLFQDLDEAVERLRGATFPPRTKTAFTSFLSDLDADVERVEARLVARDKTLGDR